ncbi:hypothetical protein BE20_04395 [Sorangium cellulosum]|nr:hypothetical protein BE20_04395 [Sorangium cellulosum]
MRLRPRTALRPTLQPSPTQRPGSMRPPWPMRRSPLRRRGSMRRRGAMRRAAATVPQSYRERVARGDFAGAIADAEARGIDATIDASPLPEIAALADAARYTGRNDLARRALLAERSRFAGSPEARSAAFLLGRMVEASSPAEAISWYERYLSESPGGPLAAEALGRKMLVTRSSRGKDAARPVAEEYLARHPHGAFAGAAAEILGPP